MRTKKESEKIIRRFFRIFWFLKKPKVFILLTPKRMAELQKARNAGDASYGRLEDGRDAIILSRNFKIYHLAHEAVHSTINFKTKFWSEFLAYSFSYLFNWYNLFCLSLLFAQVVFVTGNWAMAFGYIILINFLVSFLTVLYIKIKDKW